MHRQLWEYMMSKPSALPRLHSPLYSLVRWLQQASGSFCMCCRVCAGAKSGAVPLRAGEAPVQEPQRPHGGSC